MGKQLVSIDYLLGFKCALNIEKYSVEISADFQCIGGTSEDFERGFADAIHTDEVVLSIFRTALDIQFNNDKIQEFNHLKNRNYEIEMSTYSVPSFVTYLIKIKNQQL